MKRLAWIVVMLGSTPALAQGLPPMPATQVVLTGADVDRLLAAMPEIAALTQAIRMRGDAGASPNPAEFAKLDEALKKHGLTMEEFALKSAALIATYFTLDPKAFEKQLPSEDDPRAKAALSDPALSEDERTALRQQLRAIRENQGAIKQQMAMLATETNKKTVQPKLARIRQVLETIEAKARAAAPSGPAGAPPRR